MSETKKTTLLERLDKAGAGALASEAGVDSAEIWRTAYEKPFYDDDYTMDGKTVQIHVQPQQIATHVLIVKKTDKK